MFSFLHAADIHLDSPLRGLGRYESAPVDEIRGASRKALANLVDLALREEVAFVVLGGDLYDGDWPDFDTGLFFVGQMSRLREARIPVLGVHGNHDAVSRITRSLRLPENVHFFSSSAAETRRLDDWGVAVHGRSFASQCTSADLAKDYPAYVPGCFNLGILHTSMTGRDGHGSYAPCSEACLRESGYDYWALGHVHQREVLPGRPTIAYPGNIQGRHIREAGAKGCLLVHVDGSYAVTTEFRPLDVLRWETVSVSLANANERDEALHRVAETLRAAVEDADTRLLAARVVLSGTTQLSTAITSDLQQWTADVRAVAVDISADRLWVEKVRNETVDPRVESAVVGDNTPMSEVASIVAELSAAATAVDDLNVDFSELERKLPPELKEVVNSKDDAWWRGVLRDAQAKLIHELRG